MPPYTPSAYVPPVVFKFVAVTAAGVVPPIAGGEDKSNVPPSVKLPDVVTVPLRDNPDTVPVPPQNIICIIKIDINYPNLKKYPQNCDK